MATVLDPEGDPILDPDGDEVGEGAAPSYASQVLTDGPIAYWPFTGGSYADATGNGNTLSNNLGAPTHLSDGPVLAAADAFTVDNGHGLIVNSPGALPTDGSRQLSVEAWVRGAAFSDQVLFYQDSYSSLRSWHVAGQGGRGRAVASNTGSNTWVEGSGTVFDGTWHHYVVTIDCAADEVKFYIDGVLDVTRTDPQTGDQPNGAPLRLGSGFEGASAATVDIAHVAIYFDSILPPERVAAHYGARDAAPTVDLYRGRVGIHGGTLAIVEPTPGPTIEPASIAVHGGHLSLPGPGYGRFDPFDRETVNPPPFGGAYVGDSNWEIDDERLRSIGGGANQLTYDTGHRNQDISVSLAAVPTGFPNGAGIIFRWETAHRYAWVQVWADTDEDDEPVYLAQPWYRDDTNPDTGYTNGGTWSLPSPVGRLRAVITAPVGNQPSVPAPDVTVYWDDVLLGSQSTSIDYGHGWFDALAGKVGLYAAGAGSLFDDLHIVEFPELDYAHCTVHGGELSAEGYAPLTAGHVAVHGGELQTAPWAPIAAGHVAVHGGVLGVAGYINLDTGHATVHGGDVITGLVYLQAGHTVVYGQPLTATVVLGQGGSAAYPIGGTPLDAPPDSFTALIDEAGNQIVDENGDVLVFD